MQDKYEHWLGKLLGNLNKKPLYAITLGQTAYYSCPVTAVDLVWRRHEDHHKKQWRDEGLVKFSLKYLWYMIMYGYQNNPYEVDARAVATKGA